MTEQNITIARLPRKHAEDWLQRCGWDYDAELVGQTARTITLALTEEGLADLVSDTRYYIDQMDPANTGDVDYRPAARRCLAALEKAGLL